MNTKVIFAILISIFSLHSFAQEVTIFEVRKNLPLSDKEKVFRDFYLNAGSEVGLKPGVIVAVTRRQSLYDAYQNRSAGELQVVVGELKIMHVQKGLSVGRISGISSNAKIPVLDYESIMIGDRIDLSSARGGGSSNAEVEETPVEKPQQEATTTAQVLQIDLQATDSSSIAPAQTDAKAKPINTPTLQ